MTQPWDDDSVPPSVSISPLGWLLVAVRGVALLLIVLTGLLLAAVLRLIERPLFGWHRPVTPWITQVVCTLTLLILGLKLRVSGQQMKRIGAVVANHATWLDIFVLNARKRVYFVAKSEVAGWPGISTLAKITGTVFIKRDRREAAAQVALFRERLEAGHKLLFFPEGTSTDGRRVIAFKPTLFAAFFAEGLRDHMFLQPVTLLYRAPPGADPRFYGWWGDMDLGPSLAAVLSQRKQGEVEVIYHAPLKVSDFADRKALALACEQAVRAPMLQETGGAEPS